MGEVTQREQLGLEKSEKKIHGDLDMKKGGGGGATSFSGCMEPGRNRR